MKRRFLHIVIISILLLPQAGKLHAQNGNTGWQFSLGGGFMNYYGDVSPYRIHHGSDWQKAFKFFQYNKYYVPETSWGMTLEKRFTPGMGIMFQANKGAFAMSDRYRSPGGDYDEDAPHWNRALNFKTDVLDAGLALTFHSDNGKFLYSNSFFAPYFFIGGGITYFKVKGDLYDGEGMPYNYADPDVAPDGKYETKLRPLMTETYKEYPNVTPYADLGIGVKLRLSRVVSLTIQSDIKYSFSDYLDDVSGKYKWQYHSEEQLYAAHPGTNPMGPERNRGYDDGVNDFYIFNRAAIQFSLGSHSRRSRFKAPVIYNPGLLSAAKKRKPSDTLSENESDSLKLARLQDSLRALQKQDSLKQARKGTVALDSIQNTLEQLKLEMQSIRFTRIDQDYIIKENETKSRISLLETRKRAIENKKQLSRNDSLQILQNQLRIDSLKIYLRAVQRARKQLRNEMGNTPVITEYADSTKIIVYKEKGLPSYQSEFEDLDSLQAVYETAKENNDSIRIHRMQHTLDSMRRIRDSLRNSRQTSARDTMLSAGRSLQKDTSQQAQKDTLQQARMDTLQQARMDTLRQFRMDTLQKVRRTPEPDTNEVEPSQFYRLQQNYLADRNTGDSLKEQQLQRSLDSMTSLQESLRARYRQDSLTNMTTDRNFIQRLLDKLKRNDKFNEDLQQVTTQQKRQLNSNQEEINRLKEELNSLRKNDRSYNNGRYNRGDGDIRYLEQAVGDLYRAQASQDRRGRVEVVPRIEPTIVTGGRGNNKKYEQELEAIRLRLDSLQSEQKTASNEEENKVPNREVDSLQNRLDSLQQLEASQQETRRQDQMAALKNQVDSLTRQISKIKGEQAVADSQSFKATLSNFPVISVYFPTGSSALSDAQTVKLDPAATMVKKHKDLILSLKSYTDATGSASINKVISQKRSQSVKDVLVNQFNIPASQIKIEAGGKSASRGGSNPMQRRVDISLKAQ